MTVLSVAKISTGWQNAIIENGDCFRNKMYLAKNMYVHFIFSINLAYSIPRGNVLSFLTCLRLREMYLSTKLLFLLQPGYANLP